MISNSRIVLHLDMDAFFAAIEERDKPRLKGLPIVVGADPKEGRGRGVVSTSNYKAREYGIHSAQPISVAWKLSEKARRAGWPEAVFLEPNFLAYSRVSSEIFNYLKTLSRSFEPASVDEAFLELRKSKTENLEHDAWDDAAERAREIKNHIWWTQRLTCSIGIGPNKLIAKIASDFRKPDGLTVVRPEEVQKFLNPLPVKKIPGIGPKSETALGKIGITTIREIREADPQRLEKLFGKWGLYMHLKACGEDESPVSGVREKKSIGEQETFERDTLEPGFLVSRLKFLSRRVWSRLKAGNFSFRTVGIVVRFSDFETVTRAKTLVKPAGDPATIERIALQLFLPFLDRRGNSRKKLIRLLGVRAEKLEK